MTSRYRQTKSFEERKRESSHMREKYPDRVCIICEKSPKSGSVPDIDKNKFLVPTTLTVGQFIFIVRKKIKVEPSKAIFVFVESRILPPVSMTMIDLYAKHKHEDGLLYLTYATENTFG